MEWFALFQPSISCITYIFEGHYFHCLTTPKKRHCVENRVYSGPISFLFGLMSGFHVLTFLQLWFNNNFLWQTSILLKLIFEGQVFNDYHWPVNKIENQEYTGEEHKAVSIKRVGLIQFLVIPFIRVTFFSDWFHFGDTFYLF